MLTRSDLLKSIVVANILSLQAVYASEQYESIQNKDALLIEEFRDIEETFSLQANCGCGSGGSCNASC